MGRPATFRPMTQGMQLRATPGHGDHRRDGVALEALEHRDAAKAFVGIEAADRDSTGLGGGEQLIDNRAHRRAGMYKHHGQGHAGSAGEDAGGGTAVMLVGTGLRRFAATDPVRRRGVAHPAIEGDIVGIDRHLVGRITQPRWECGPQHGIALLFQGGDLGGRPLRSEIAADGICMGCGCQVGTGRLNGVMLHRGSHEHTPQIGGLAAIASSVERHMRLQDGSRIIQDGLTSQGWERVHQGISSAGRTWWLALPSLPQIDSPTVFSPSGSMGYTADRFFAQA
jgi:hypothetical protein